MRQFTCPKAVTHPSTNRARCRATALIETNALLLCPSVYRSVSPPVSQSVRPSIHPSVRSSVCLSVHRPSVCTSVTPSVHHTIRPSIHLLSIRLSVHPSVCQSTCLSFNLPIHLSVLAPVRLSVSVSVRPPIHPSVCRLHVFGNRMFCATSLPRLESVFLSILPSIYLSVCVCSSVVAAHSCRRQLSCYLLRTRTRSH